MPNTTLSSVTDILIAAESLFSAHGYDGVSMQQVAKEAHISKSNIYHHFASKDDLYMSVLKHGCQEVQNLTQRLNQEKGTITERLTVFSQEHLKHLNKKSPLSKLILRELLDSSSERGRELAEQVFNEQFAQIRQLLQSGQANGEVRQDVDAAHMATAIAGLNVFLFQVWPMLQHFPDSAFQNQSNSGDIMLELLLHGLSTPNPQGILS
ncbi:MAG: TetR/AcrR family transcriptional regulator [Mariprofundaceae bacterium]|nr:TetR/AcrR family transcriptional regulator [Mariprofundaceae bacterium]